MRHEISHDRIQLHVLQLFSDLLAAPHVEIIEASLPKMLHDRFIEYTSEFEKNPGGIVYENLYHFRRIADPGFADEKVNVLRYDNVADQSKSVSHADRIKNADETIPTFSASKQRASMKITKRYEMKIALAVASFQRIAHGRKARTLESHQGAAPQSPSH